MIAALIHPPSRAHRRALAGALVLALLPCVRGAYADELEAPAHFELEPPPLIADRPYHPIRATFETATAGALGAAWYWSDLDFNTRDWDLTWNWPSWKRKFTLEAVRFDQNLYQTNAVSHPRMGVLQYATMRGNGFGLPASVLGTLGSSLFWEYLVEFKEMPSVNDIITNTTAGLAIGEPFYQLGEFFLRSRPNLFTRGMAAAFSPIASSNDWYEERWRRGEGAGLLGLSDIYPHRFEITGAMARRSFAHPRTAAENPAVDGGGGSYATVGTAPTDAFVLTLSSDLVMLPPYGRSGHVALWTSPGTFTSMTARLVLEQPSRVSGSLLTRTSLFGRYSQIFVRDLDRQLTGHGSFVGAGSAFEYESFARPDRDDHSAVMNFFGPVAELVVREGGLHLKLAAELYADFAMVDSLALAGRLPTLTSEIFHPAAFGGNLPSVLGARGYYYAYGLTAGTRMAISYWGWDTGAEVRGDDLHGITAFDRFQDEITHEPALVDQRVLSRAWVAISPWGSGPRVELGMRWRWRHSVADDLTATTLDTDIAIALSLAF